MIRKVKSLAIAESVINLLLAGDNVINIKKDWWIESYQNGREQGYVLTDIQKVAYYICENRHTNDICIYKGQPSNYGLDTEAWYNAHTFGTDFNEAVDWLINELKSYE